MRIIYFKKDEKHVLGRAGENGATRITVDVAAWAAEYPSGTGALIYKRPDGQVYPLTTALDGGQLYAVLTSVDTAISGVCRVEAQWIEGAVVVKSATYEGSIASSLGEAGSVPAASPSWVDDMAALGVTVEADAAQVAADKASAAGSAADAQAARVAAEQSAMAAQSAATGAQNSVAAHTSDTNNPHAVTAAQIGAVSYDADQTLTDAQQKKARKNIAASYVIPRAGAGDGRNLKTIFASAADLHAAISAGDFSDIQIGDYWPISLTGTYRDVGTYTCPAGTTLYSDTALTIAAGTAPSVLEAQWMDATYCKVSSGGDKYCATSDCLAYYERTLSNAAVNLEVAAINPYWRYGDSGELTGAKPHLIFAPKDCLPHTLRYRKANTAWTSMIPIADVGTEYDPWRNSALWHTFNDPDYGILPLLLATELGPYIYAGPSNLGMRYHADTRSSESDTTPGGGWSSRGRLFLPHEDEVWGYTHWSWNSYTGQFQWPIFAGTRRRISKGIGFGGSRYFWWLESVCSGSATNACGVYNGGTPGNGTASSAFGGAPCFLAI